MRKTTSAKQTVAVTLAALFVAATLNASDMESTASALPFGPRRDIALALVRPVGAVSQLFQLDLPRRSMDGLLALRAPATLLVPARRVLAASAVSQPIAAPQAAPPPAAPPAGATSSHAGAAPRPTPVPAARAEAHARIPTGVSMWVAGDSVSGQLGSALKRHAAANGTSAEAEYRVSTGLARNDVFDWPQRIAAETARLDPTAVVLLFGANDNQHMREGNRSLRFATAEWRAEYARRVGAILDALLAEGREVYWAGQPVMRDERFGEQMAYLNQIYLEEISKRPGASYIDSWSVFSDGEGRYAQYLPDENGQLVRVRESDGIHLTFAGGNRLAGAVLRVLAARRQPPPPPPTPAPTPPPGEPQGPLPQPLPLPSPGP